MEGFLDVLLIVRDWMDNPINLGGYVITFWEVIVFGVVGGITFNMIAEAINGWS